MLVAKKCSEAFSLDVVVLERILESWFQVHSNPLRVKTCQHANNLILQQSFLFAISAIQLQEGEFKRVDNVPAALRE